MDRDDADPKALIREAYRIDGIGAPECRSIFLDWALSVPPERQKALLHILLARHGEEGHPMTEVLRQGLGTPERTGRRGGWRARRV